MLREMKIKESKTEKQLNDEPFRILGYGINAFFQTTYALATMLFVMTLFVIPVLYVNSYNDQQGLESYNFYALNRFTLGNLGGALSLCMQKRVRTEKMDLHCPAGKMYIGEHLKAGIISSKSLTSHYCTEEALFKGEKKNNI